MPREKSWHCSAYLVDPGREPGDHKPCPSVLREEAWRSVPELDRPWFFTLLPGKILCLYHYIQWQRQLLKEERAILSRWGYQGHRR